MLVFLIDFRVEFVDELPKGKPPVEKVVWCICSRLELVTYSVDCFLIVCAKCRILELSFLVEKFQEAVATMQSSPSSTFVKSSFALCLCWFLE